MMYFLNGTNRRSFLRGLALIILLAVLGACSSLVPQPSSTDDTLVVFSVSNNIPPSFPSNAVFLELTVKDVDEPIKIRPEASLVVRTGLAPGQHQTIRAQEPVFSATKHESTRYTAPEPFAFEIPFELQPGKITVFPVHFTFNIKRKRDGYYYWWEFSPLTDTQRHEVVEGLTHEENTSLWCFRAPLSVTNPDRLELPALEGGRPMTTPYKVTRGGG